MFINISEKLKTTLSILFFAIFSITISPPSLNAHSGDTDFNGGHYDRKTGVYHSHSGSQSSRTTVTSRNGIKSRTTTRETKTWVAGKGVLNVGKYRKELPEVIEIINGSIIRVSDGDTIEIFHNGKIEKVQLYGINTPERNEFFGQDAQLFTDKMVTGKIVTVELLATDHSGQIVGLLMVDGINLNRELVHKGYASVNNSECIADYCAEWKEREEDARKRKYGLWASP